MTFNPTEFHLWTREYPMFSYWANSKGILFPPKEVAEDNEEKYDLTSKAYVLMKRLSQSYDVIMNMDSSERDRLFEMEMKLIKEEAKQNEK